MGGNRNYRVQPDEQGIVLRYSISVQLQMGYIITLPFPIETVLKPKVTRENQEVGIRTSSIGRGTVGRDVPEESLRLPEMRILLMLDFQFNGS